MNVEMRVARMLRKEAHRLQVDYRIAWEQLSKKDKEGMSYWQVWGWIEL